MNPESITVPTAAEGNCRLLRQGIRVLEQLSVAQYADAQHGHSSAGAQFRHILDHYAALFDGMRDGRVNYDARRRDREIELDPAVAVTAADRWIGSLEDLDLQDCERMVLVQSDSGGGPEHADWRESSVGRELQFLASHTVHHYALIKLLLEWHGVSLGADFGMAPSTQAYHANR